MARAGTRPEGRAADETYGEAYYAAYGIDAASGEMVASPYRRGEAHWERFFDAVADGIVATLAPRRALDVGCAIGFLVEALRARGVAAEGLDASSYAISQVPPELRPYCRVARATDEIVGHYDLVTCIEVLEHLPGHEAELAIANICRHADAVLFSSTPDGFADPTHLNVRPPDYWAERFAAHGFLRDLGYDAGFLSPHAVLFRRDPARLPEAVARYEREVARLRRAEEGARRVRERVEDELARAREELARSEAARERLEKLRDELAAAEDELARAREELARSEAARERLEGALAEEVAARAAAWSSHQAIVHALEDLRRGLLGELERARAGEAAASARADASARDAERLRRELETLYATKLLRWTGVLRRAYAWARFRRPPADLARPRADRSALALARGEPSGGALRGGGPASPGGAPGDYEEWVARYDTLDEMGRARVIGRLAALAELPLVSVVVPVHDPLPAHLHEALESVRRQIYPHWELCICDDASRSPQVAALLDRLAREDPRVRLVRRATSGHISAATNDALALAAGEWVAFLDHDDVLAEDALAELVLAAVARPGTRFVYSDEDKLDATGRRCEPYFKPDFDPLLLCGQNYPAHLRALRRDLLTELGGCRAGFEGSQDWDLHLRLAERVSPAEVVHVPRVLYHWRMHADSTARSPSAKPYALQAGARAVAEHLARTGRDAEVVVRDDLAMLQVRWCLPDPAPRVSVVVPTRDGPLLGRCLQGLWARTTYPDLEIVLVDNGSETAEAKRLLDAARRRGATVVEAPGPFNYAALNNRAVAATSGEVVCLLNDDVEPTAPRWLEAMVAELLQPGVGAVGARLLYPDGTLQHAGVVVGLGGVAGYAHRGAPGSSPGYFGQALLSRRCSAVTAACMVVRREAWEAVGGFDAEHLPVAFNDVDLCLRLADAGWAVVYCPHAELVHHESATRGPDDLPHTLPRFQREIAYMKGRWGDRLLGDPWYNPNLTLDREDYALAFPPRLPPR